METVTISNAETVQYQKGKDGFAFLLGRIEEKRTKVRNRIFHNQRAATAEEKTLLEGVKTALLAFQKYIGKSEITPLVVGSGLTSLPKISENFDTENVVGTREEQAAAREAFQKKQKADLESLDGVKREAEEAYYSNTAAGTDLADALKAALAKLATIE